MTKPTSSEWLERTKSDDVIEKNIRNEEPKTENKEITAEYDNILTKDGKSMPEVVRAAKNDASIFYDKREQAKLFIESQPMFYDRAGLYWLWDNEKFRWEIIDETDLLNKLKNISLATDTIKSKEKQETMEALRQIGRLNLPKETKKTWVQLHDMIIDVKTGEVMEATPEYLNVNPIPWKMGESSETPTMDRIFEEWVGKDHVKTLYEIIAYCMLPDYPIHRIFCFVGPGLNGKSKFLELVARFLGKDNVSNTELDVILGSRFEMAKVYKKLAVMMGETDYTAMSKTNKLKRMTGQDMIGYEFKNKNPFDDYNYAKVLISTNGLPMTEDKSVGFYRRWMIIKFPNTFSEKKDILAEIPEIEYENLAKRSIATLKDILEVREFHLEGSLKDREDAYEETSNPLQKFIDDFVNFDPSGEIPKWKFKNKFVAWMVERGYREWSETEIGINMKKFGLEEKKIYFGEKRWMCWIGMNFKDSVQGVQGVQGGNTQNLHMKTKLKGVDTMDTMDTKPMKPISTDQIVKIMQKLKGKTEPVKLQKIIDYLVPYPKGKIIEGIGTLKEEGRIMETTPGMWMLL